MRAGGWEERETLKTGRLGAPPEQGLSPCVAVIPVIKCRPNEVP